MIWSRIVFLIYVLIGFKLRGDDTVMWCAAGVCGVGVVVGVGKSCQQL